MSCPKSKRSTAAVAAAVLLLFLAPSLAQGKTCLMVYQMADNNLEYFINQDYFELSQSPVMKSGDLRTWVYYDAFNQGGLPLPNTVDTNGNDILAPFMGSRYVTYDANLGKMRVDVELEEEQDSDSVVTIQSFMEYALSDCLADGFTSTMAVFSSHGGGFAGYGGDENINARHLMQTNQGVASAIRGALANTAGAPAKLEVIGFDACLMQTVEAADDYMSVAQYILASEAVEPGHGWAYSNLSAGTSALELSKEVVQAFVTETQGSSSYHQAPKTLAVVDTDKYNLFMISFETFVSDLLAVLQAGDKTLNAYVSRARSTAVSFEGVVDVVGSQNPSALDVGSFLQKLATMCNPGGTLGPHLKAAQDAYDAMFIERAVGPGTAPGTGMHITWPHQGEYLANTPLWDQVLFSNSNYATAIAPNYQAFLKYFLINASTDTGDQSVCGQSASNTPGAAVGAGALILSDTTRKDAAGNFIVEVEISLDVSDALVEYGVELTTPLQKLLVEKEYVPESDNYLYLLGGDIAGEYDGSKFSAAWDQNFYFLSITSGNEPSFEALYVFDEGDGSKKVPAMFFPESAREQVADLQFLDFLFFDSDRWVDQGARFSFLKFSEDKAQGRINNQLTLFVSGAENTFAEHPPAAGGLLVPLIYVKALVQGREITTLPGGFHQTIIEWNDDLQFNLLTTPAQNIWNRMPDADAVMVGMKTFNYNGLNPSSEPESRVYDVIRPAREGSGTELDPDIPSSDCMRFSAKNLWLQLTLFGMLAICL